MSGQNQPQTKKQIREIRIVDLVTYTILPPLAIIALWGLGLWFCLGLDLKIPPDWVIYVILGVATYFLLKRFAIGLVLAYKAFAPLEVRARCRFTPTCSTYMIIAIKKYGLIFGVIKGIRRLRRCKPPNGGVDYP